MTLTYSAYYAFPAFRLSSLFSSSHFYYSLLTELCILEDLVYFIYVHVCAAAHGTQKRVLIPWNWSWRWLGAA